MMGFKKQLIAIVVSVIVIITSVVYINKSKRPVPAEQKAADKIYKEVSESLFNLSENTDGQNTDNISKKSLSYADEEDPSVKQNVPDKTSTPTGDYKNFKEDTAFQPASWEPYEFVVSILNSPVEDLKDIEKSESLHFIYIPNAEKEGFDEFVFKYLGSKLKEIDAKYPCEEGLTRWYSYDVIPEESCSEELPYREGYTLVALSFKYL